MKLPREIYPIFFAIFAINAFASAEVSLTRSATGKGIVAVAKAVQSDHRQFSFSVQSAPDGTVSGEAILVDPGTAGTAPGGPYTLELDISCMNVVGNTVFFGGTTRQTSDPALEDTAYFSAQDNGSGIDKISRVYFFDDDPNTFGDPQLCMGNQPDDFPLEPIQSGEITVQR